MHFITLIATVFFATAALAEDVIDPAAHFPPEAITKVQQPEVPGSPENPESPPVPESPESPPQPSGVVPEQWPANTVPVFVIACTQGNVQLIAPCRCAIQSLMQSMTHREFREISAKNAMDKDIRYTAARQQCALKSQSKKKP